MEKVSVDSQIFTRGIEDVITRSELQNLLKSGRKLRIKLGIDGTSPDLHIGHAVPLWKIKALQEAGHKAVILLGDYTTRIGDPEGKLKTRPTLSESEIRKNLKSIEKQVKGILLTSPQVFELRYSSEWYQKISFAEILKLLSLVTHSRLIARDMFQQRTEKGEEIYVHELIYPILQGYDSVMLKSDLTIIGSDQLFNEHMGRFLQEKFGQRPQVIVSNKILPGLDGGEKMSKSLGNYISLLDSPQDKFGKTMRVLDSLIVSYLESYTDLPARKIQEIEQGFKRGKNPKEAKLMLAQVLVQRYHGPAVARREKDEFVKVFSRGELPGQMPGVRIEEGEWDLPEFLLLAGLAKSKSEARRLIGQGGVEIDKKVLKNPFSRVLVKKGSILRVGRKFVRVL